MEKYASGDSRGLPDLAPVVWSSRTVPPGRPSTLPSLARNCSTMSRLKPSSASASEASLSLLISTMAWIHSFVGVLLSCALIGAAGFSPISSTRTSIVSRSSGPVPGPEYRGVRVGEGTVRQSSVPTCR
jgi:hypothetical protein